MESAKVFISSTWLDLMPERSAVEKALHRLKAANFVGMEYFGTRDASPRDVSLDEVDGAAVYVGVIGHRYGSGITEDEYRRARVRGLPCLLYLKDGSSDGAFGEADKQRLDALRSELQQAHTVCLFRSPDELATRIVADLHNLLFERLVVQGIGVLRADYDTRIQRFLSEYIGDTRRPIAFGGRDGELERLNRWVKREDDRPYALLAGPAGRGKSALLVHWARVVTQDPNTAVIFFPVSVRFRTNLARVAFATICARLASLHDEPVPGSIDTPAEVWRALLLSYLSRNLPDGRRLLIILDGADETADWQVDAQFFPISPPSRLRVLISARYLAGDVSSAGWLERLGWTGPRIAEAIDLRPLNPDGLAQVLKGMSVPLEQLSGRSEIVAELFRLTQGDPLLVNLYAADLWAKGDEVARLTPSDLIELEPGLDGYFRRWWEDQRALWGAQSPLREPAVNEVLNTLSCAMGPLSSAELLDLLSPAASVSIWALDDTMRSLQRFVIGDGKTQGYAFSHPRLADYFYDGLAQVKQAHRQEARFVAWGLRCIESLESSDTAQQQPVPSYVLQFVRRHMERVNSDAREFLVLTRKPWARAWERLDRGSYAGFLADLNQVHAIATRANLECLERGDLSPFVAAQLRCALCTSSIASLAADMSAGALLALIDRDVWSPAQAIAYAAHISDVTQRLCVLFELSGLIAAEHRPLALGSMLSETRTLLASADGRDCLRGVLATLLATPDALLGVDSAARVVAGITAAARQLPESDRDWLIGVLAEQVRNQHRIPERLATLLQAMAAQLPAPQAEPLQADLRRVLERMGHDGRPLASFVAERLRVLRSALRQDGPEAGASPLLGAALGAAARFVGTLARLDHAERDELIDAGLACAKYLPPAEHVALIEQLAPAVDAAHVARIVDACLDGFESTGSARLSTLLQRLPIPARGVAARDLAERVEAACLPAPDMFLSLNEQGAPADAAQAARWLDRCVQSLEPGDLILLCSRAARDVSACLPAAQLARVALQAIGQLNDNASRLDALLALLDHIVPAGALDSQEGWRASPAEQRLAGPLRRLLRAAEAPDAEVRSVAQAVFDGALDRTPGCERLRWLLRGERAGVQGTDSDAMAPTRTLLALVAKGDSGGEAFAESVRTLIDAEGQAWVAEALQRTAAELPRMHAQRVACEVLEAIGTYGRSPGELCTMIATLTGPELFPPSGDLLAAICGAAETASLGREAAFDRVVHDTPLPDIVRHELLLLRLRRIAATGHAADTVLEILSDISRLTVLSDELLGLALSTLANDGLDNLNASKRSVLMCLLSRLTPALLPRWLDLLGDATPATRRGCVREMQHCRGVEADVHWREIIDALQYLQPLRKRAAWLIDIADFVDSNVQVESASMLSDSHDPLERLQVACAVLPYTTGPDRHQLLLAALKLARSSGAPPAFGRGLVQFVVDGFACDATMTDEAAKTAVSLTDAALRTGALTALAPLLSAQTMAWAATAMCRLDDMPQRLRTMLAIIAAIRAPERREIAVDRIWHSVEALPGAPGAAAALCVAPLLDPSRRWEALAAAVPRLGRLVSGFATDELLDALQRSLPGAPAALCSQAIAWLQQLPADRRRATALAELFPSLPHWVQIPALGLIELSGVEPAFFEPLSVHVPDELLEDADQWSQYLSRPVTRALHLVDVIKRRTAGPSITTPPFARGVSHDDLCALLRKGSELARAPLIRTLSLDAELGPALESELIAAGAGLNDAGLRCAVAAYLAVFAQASDEAPAVRAIERIESAADRAIAGALLALRMPGSTRSRLLAQACRWLGSETDPNVRLAAAAELALIAPELLPQCMEVMLAAPQRALRVAVLGELIQRQHDDQAATAVACLQRLEHERDRLAVLLQVAPAVGGAAAQAALQIATGFTTDVDRTRAMVALVERLPEASQPACEAVLDAIGADFAWLEAVGKLAQRWPACLTPARETTALAHLQGIDDDEFIARWLRRVCPAWRPETRHVLIDCVSRLREPDWTREALSAVASACSAEYRTRLIELARSIDDPFQGAVALAHLAHLPHVSAPFDAALLDEAIALAGSGGRQQRFVDALVTMVAAAQTVADAILSRLIADYPHRGLRTLSALTAISGWLDERQAEQVLALLLREGSAGHGDECAALLIELYPRLAAPQQVRLIEAIASLCSERLTTRILDTLAPALAGQASAAGALATVLALRSSVYRQQGLTALLICLDDDQQASALTALAQTSSEHDRFQLLRQTLPDIRPNARRRLRELAHQFADAEYRDTLLQLMEAGDATPTAPFAARIEPHIATGFDPAAALRYLMNELVSARGPMPIDASNGDIPTPRMPGELLLSRLLSRLRGTEAEADRHAAIRTAIPTLQDPQLTTLAQHLPAFLSERNLGEALRAVWGARRQARPDVLLAELHALSGTSAMNELLCSVATSAAKDPALRPVLSEYIDDVTRRAGRLGRVDCLALLSSLMPVVAAVGGDEALCEMVDAIDDAGSLWP